MRAALSRLKEREKLRNLGRGIYGLPEKPMIEWSFNRSWRDYVEEIIQWSGHWVLASWSNNAKLSRSESLSKEDLLHRYGFRKWRPQLFIRPDNITGGLPAMRQRIATWSAADQFEFSEMRQVEMKLETHLMSHWNDSVQNHDNIVSLLNDSLLKTRGEITGETVAEVLSVGRCAVKSVLKNPRLPEPYGNHANLRELSTTLATYEVHGLELWTQYLEKCLE
ncbi:hypothetical protein [Pseudovibrio sp. Tun.PSC04-5.I4]|uniref:hypothetical protein n=1 Tax=Pseudovibrio sp. Tun.PSC04-5.I4 TaxID=1798213 RepID=UPI000A8686D2|nr:hypothetical protein [Pseudovibrio sp. Tun.PSC04-5.I4]